MNDHSEDNSLEILEIFGKTDNRIKILNNHKNKGLLYSRATGILNSSGEYLMNLDPDDELRGSNSLKNLYNKAKRFNIDIITFTFLNEKKNKNINICDNINIIQKQPELFFSIFDMNNQIKDFFIWNKIIKKEIFLKAYEAFKKEIKVLKWNYFEDDIWNILVNRFAKSKLCIDRVMYIYHYNKDSLINKRFGVIEFENLLYRHKMYYKIFSTKDNEKFLMAEYIYLFNRLNSRLKTLLLINDHRINKRIIKTFQFFLKNYNCSNYQKKNIIKFINLINAK